MSAFGLTTQIHKNHFKSTLLLAGFPVLLLGMIWSFFAALGAMAQKSLGAPGLNIPAVMDAGWDGVAQYGQWAVLGAGIWFAVAYVFHDNIMRAATGARPVTRQEFPKIYNMLENLCIARGIPMPAFEIIDSSALNAFASGLSTKNFKIVLTQGIVDALADDELESVIGHELTHIANRDVRLLIISVIFVGIISFLAQLTYRFLVSGMHRGVRSGDRRGGAAVVIVVAMVILSIGYLLALVIRFALSRKREYLADAGSIELTKNPEAMMRALQRISGHADMPRLPQEVAQMCIENRAGFFSLFATHPPIEDRIRAISEMTNTPVPALQPVGRSSAGPWGH